MRVVRVDWQKRARWGVMQGGEIALYSHAPYLGGEPTGEQIPWDDSAILAPCEPTKVVCVGRNYAAHAAELGNELPERPLLFLKPPSSLLPPGGQVVLPPSSERVDFEGELALVMGERAKDVSSERAMEYVFGATCFNDVTARDLQRADKTFTRGKGFDTFGPCGPWIETEFNLEGSRIETRVNGAVRQSAPISQMIFSMGTLVAYISTIMTLEAGDLVVTGTPEGVGPLSSGDEVEVDITGVALLRHGVK